MDGGAFYGRRSDNASSVVPPHHFAIGSSPSTSWLPPAAVDGGMSYPADAAFSQKLDRVLILLENQRKEIDGIKEDTSVLKYDMEALKQQRSFESSSSSADSPPSKKKLPTELSVTLCTIT